MKNTIDMVAAMDVKSAPYIQYLTTETYYHVYELSGIVWSMNIQTYNDAIDYLVQLSDETRELYKRDILIECARNLKIARYGNNELASMNVMYLYVKKLQKDHEKILCSIRTSANSQQCTRFFNQLWSIEKCIYILDCVKWHPYSQEESDTIRASALGTVNTVYSALYLYLNGNQGKTWNIETGDTLTKISDLFFEVKTDATLETLLTLIKTDKQHAMLGMYYIHQAAKIFLDIMTEKYAPNHDMQKAAKKCLDLLLDMPVW